ncbi:hypothetical protein EOPP23_01515 [Endozoicomonas sp. OPT23]|nr:hypothetical protein [Endozoicomonas sp. OPT23]
MTVSAASATNLSDVKDSQFYKADIPTIPFTATSSTGAETRLVIIPVDEIQHFKGKDGEVMLYGGKANVCSKYDNLNGSEDRQCLQQETVLLVRSSTYDFSFCTSFSGDECQKAQSIQHEYPTQYDVRVMKRLSVSNDFTPTRTAFIEKVEMSVCSECSDMDL